jgi:hypothetical protein
MFLSCGCRGCERYLSTAFGCMTREREGEQRDAGGYATIESSSTSLYSYRLSRYTTSGRVITSPFGTQIPLSKYVISYLR